MFSTKLKMSCYNDDVQYIKTNVPCSAVPPFFSGRGPGGFLYSMIRCQVINSILSSVETSEVRRRTRRNGRRKGRKEGGRGKEGRQEEEEEEEEETKK